MENSSPIVAVDLGTTQYRKNLIAVYVTLICENKFRQDKIQLSLTGELIIRVYGKIIDSSSLTTKNYFNIVSILNRGNINIFLNQYRI